jgi:acyl carrier protein phosphodiesterase
VNFLAHIYLAGENEEHVIGQVMADFLERGWQERVSDGVLQGIRLHQQIDMFTDRHDVFRRSRLRLPLELRRYAGIAVDIFYDHVLAQNWEKYHPMALDEYAQSRYEILGSRPQELTDRMSRAMPSIVTKDWLTSYRELEGIERALKGVSKRLKRENPLAEAGLVLRRERAGFEEDFSEFFPDLEAFAAKLRAGS